MSDQKPVFNKAKAEVGQVVEDPRLEAVKKYVSQKEPTYAEQWQESAKKHADDNMIDDLTGTGIRRDGSRSANAAEALDGIVGVPVRTAISQAQDGNFNMDGLKAVFNSIGTDPKKAPTGVDIALKATNNPYLGTAIATAADLAQLPVPGMTAGVAGKVAAKELPAILKEVSSPEMAVALKGAKRAEYLKALDEVYGAREQRAKDLGFGKKTWYHGTGSDIQAFDPSLGQTNAGGPTGAHAIHFAENPKLASQYAYEQSPEWYRKHLAEDNRLMRAARDEKTPEAKKAFADYANGTRKEFEARLAAMPDGYQRETGNNIIPARLKTGNMVAQELDGNSVGYDEARFLKEIKDEGKHGGVVFKNAYDNLNHIRSTNPELQVPSTNIAAVFDPKDIRSTNAAFDPRFKDSPLLLAAKTAGEDNATVRTAAQKVLDGIKSPEQAVTLKGAEREAYLQALDVVHGSREQRAKDLGFGPDKYYHGTNNNFEAFEPSKIGSATDEGKLGKGFYFSTDPNVVSSKENIGLPVKLKANAPLDLKYDNWGADKTDILNKSGGMSAKHDSVKLDYSPVNYNHTEAMVPQPNQIRSVNAAFDPRFKDSPLLLAAKTAGEDNASVRAAAQKVLDSIKSPEQAVALKGKERAAYLEALDLIHGSKEQRAKALGFGDETLYHGSKSSKPLAQFSNDFSGTGVDAGNLGTGTYVTSKKFIADAYRGNGGETYALKARDTNPLQLPEPMDSEHSRSSIVNAAEQLGVSSRPKWNAHGNGNVSKEFANELADKAQSAGHTSIGQGVEKNILQPNQLRRTDAAFDPRFKDSPLLLAAKTGANLDDPKVQALLQSVAKEHKLDYNQLRKEFIEKKRELAVQDRNKNKYAEGGPTSNEPKERREDATPPPVQETPEERKRKTAEASQKGTSVPSATELYNRLKNAWAEGGMVDGHHMGALAMMALEEQQQGKETNPRMLAEGSGPLAAPQGPIDINSLSQINGNLPEQPDPTTVEKQELYNQAIQSNDNRNAAMHIATKALGPAGPLFDTLANVFVNNPVQGEAAAFGPNGQPPQKFDPQAWGKAENAFNEKQIAMQKSEAQNAQALAYNNEMRARAGLPPLPAPMQQPDPKDLQTAGVMQEAAALQGQQGIAPQAKPANPMEGTDPTSMLMGGYNKRMAGINQEANALGQLGQQQAEMLDQSIKAKTDAQAHYQQEYQALDQERQHHIQDIRDGYIDPNKYWDNHSKVAAGIGMILAGFNPTNSPNAAVNFLKFQMEQNLNAQAKNLDSKNNLLQANMRQFGNLKDATEMTRLMQNDIVTQQLQSAAAKAQNPMAKAAALKAAGQLQMEAAPMFQQFAMRRALMGLSQTNNPQAVDQMIGYLRVMNPEMAKEMESRYVPGVGMASVPLTPEVRGKLVGMQELNTAANDLLGFVKTHTTLNPYSKEYAIGQQKALALQSMVREGKLGTVYREGEQPLLDKFVNSNPAGALKMIQTVPKLQELMHSNSMQMNTLKRNYGLPASAPAPQASNSPQAALVWARSNPTDPRAAKILSMLGQK